jgi:Trypsin-like peptidase domain
MSVNGNVLSSGTGFIVISKIGPVLITNRHNVTGRHQISGKCLSKTGGIPDSVTIYHNDIRSIGKHVQRIERVLKDDGSPAWHEHPTLGPKADFVAVPLRSLSTVQIYSYEPYDSGPKISCNVTDTVSVIGFPFGLKASGLAIWATGFIASEIALDYDNSPCFLIDCRTRQGQSGSPVIAFRSGGMIRLEDGSTAAFKGAIMRFLGVYSGRVNDESDLGIVWKYSAIAQLIDSLT